jgi:hypothetical protein
MCFEFEWLYWAQLAQDKERRRAEAEQVRALEQQAPAAPVKPAPVQEPAHA